MMLDDIDSYPYAPGHKAKTGPSAEAAASMRKDATKLQADCFAYVKDRGAEGSTADECAHDLGESVLSVRPRFSELLRLGHIVDSGERRKNRSGRSATVWKASA